MNKRAITWLLAAFLALSANAAVPVARARAGSVESAIVWIARERSEQRVQLSSRPVATARSRDPLNYEQPAKSQYFAVSLYQRPPPFLR